MSRKAIGEYYLIFKKKEKPEALESDERQPLEPIELPATNAIESDEQQPLEPVNQPQTNVRESDEQQPLEQADQLITNPSVPIEIPKEVIENIIVVIKPNEEKAESNV